VPVKIVLEFGEPVIQSGVSGACIRRRAITVRQSRHPLQHISGRIVIGQHMCNRVLHGAKEFRTHERELRGSMGRPSARPPDDQPTQLAAKHGGRLESVLTG